jgi:hypothetical protein
MARRLLVYTLIVLCSMNALAQEWSFDSVNNHSYRLYEQGAWTELRQFGREAKHAGHSFLNLHLRLGYAAFQQGNYVDAFQQYQSALTFDSYNSTARYYQWLCKVYLNQTELSGRYGEQLDAATRKESKLQGVRVWQVGNETSMKFTETTVRGNGIYSRVDAKIRLAPNWYLEQAVALYNQTISEPLLMAVRNNRAIPVNQREYYGKLTGNLSKNWQVKLGYHYLYTPFNNFIYNNHVVLAGVRWYGAYLDVQADAVVGTVTDTTQQQFNLQVTYYPLGNMHLYGITTGILRNRNGATGTNIKQVIGGRILKNTWLEGNATLGKFNNLTENDALYVYNAIDPNTFKGGMTLYYAPGKLGINLGYTFERRQLFQRTIFFNQHSITGGITWKP